MRVFSKLRLYALTGIGSILLAWGFSATAQTTVTLNSASLNQLQQDLVYTNKAVPQTIVCTFNGTINVTTPLFIAGNIILMAPSNYNVTLNGLGSTRIFQVLSNATLTLSNLTISGGANIGTNGSVGTTGANGTKGGVGGNGTSGAAGYGGALYNQSTTYIYNCTLLTNKAAGGNGGPGGPGGNGSTTSGGNGGIGASGGYATGGAIYNTGILLISNSSLLGNFAIAGTGGLGGTNGTGGFAYPGAGGTGGGGYGGAIFNSGTATIYASTFAANYCISGNSQAAGGTPGGNGTGPNGPNGTPSLGGGAYSSGITTLINCTFSDNQVTGGAGGNGGQAQFSYLKAGAGGNGGSGLGGGFYNDTTSTSYVTNCTFANGVAYGGTNGVYGNIGASNSYGLPGYGYGANIGNNGTIILRASILAYPTNAYNYSGSVTDAGYNLSSDSTPALNTGLGSSLSTDPLLIGLTTNGGPTLTFYLQWPVSPAIDAILTGPAPTFDQRGYRRPIGSYADIGAVEWGTPTYTITGQLTPSNNAAYTAVTIVATGTGTSFSAMPDSTGAFLLSGLVADTYLVVPQTTNGFTFSPASNSVTLNTSITNATLTYATTPTYKVGGYISNLTGSVTVQISTFANGTETPYLQTTTDTNFYYVFPNIPSNTYTIQPVNTATFFYRPKTLQTNISADNTNINFQAVPPYYNVVGSISNGPANVIVTATVSGSSVPSATVVSTNGIYSFASLQANGYQISAQPTNGYTFTPSLITVTVNADTNIPQIFVGITSYSVSGRVFNDYAPLVMAAGSGTANYTVSSDSNGNFTLPAVVGGTYTIFPSAVPAGVTFSPTSVPLTVSSNTVNVNFTALTTNRPKSAFLSSPSNNTFSFKITNAIPFMSYRIQSSTSVTSGVWTDVATNIIGANGSSTFSATNNIHTGNRFFRTVTP